MKTNYLFAAILLSSTLGGFISSRSMKTVCCLISALIALYALLRHLI